MAIVVVVTKDIVSHLCYSPFETIVLDMNNNNNNNNNDDDCMSHFSTCHLLRINFVICYYYKKSPLSSSATYNSVLINVIVNLVPYVFGCILSCLCQMLKQSVTQLALPLIMAN